MREQEGQSQRVVEVPVGQQDVADPAELQRPAPHVEGDSRRVDPEPGLVAGTRSTLDREVVEAKGLSQISVYSQRRIGFKRSFTASQSGSIIQSAPATEESSELPSWGVKQKP